jgi:hypothetical protein
MLTTASAYADMTITKVDAADGALTLTVALDTAKAELALANLKVGGETTLTQGVWQARVRTYDDLKGGRVMIALLANQNFTNPSTNNAETAVFVIAAPADGSASVINRKPIVSANSLLDRDLNFFVGKLADYYGCAPGAAAQLLGTYAVAFPSNPLAVAAGDVENGRFQALPNRGCALLPENAVSPDHIPAATKLPADPSTAKPAAPVAKKHTWVQNMDTGEIYDKYTHEPYPGPNGGAQGSAGRAESGRYDRGQGGYGRTDVDQYGRPTSGGYGRTQADPYGRGQTDGYGRTQGDGYGRRQYDPYGRTQRDPYGRDQSDPYGQQNQGGYGTGGYGQDGGYGGDGVGYPRGGGYN